jgi:hypothetical protein
MSSNKFRYYDVTVTRVVKALTQADAISLAAAPKARVPGEVLATFVDVDRIPATEAHQLSLSANS